mmetsp:Transcript_34988/g.56623  ORF Transcript_34988/g.56623 Transcript_34988/m.56623 type:complete len:571 (+) Transcript_34988:962-2674(+)|eukprot:CAMPEP_0184671370 /NCGR_PEP_ID=MMETSP0308-20130426/85453_1 /TAXON_ID=38269 /ORGANISM="Gloeochaete witrockiana, Strain SAG 46.84" /LENGTH=570 /DNA_ID=CAMNT_0027118475 /DNA_START=1735 /DNA_END=3447 /DNA_ORIENTATION=-
MSNFDNHGFNPALNAAFSGPGQVLPHIGLLPTPMMNSLMPNIGALMSSLGPMSGGGSGLPNMGQLGMMGAFGVGDMMGGEAPRFQHCQEWLSTGRCSYGDQCIYYHEPKLTDDEDDIPSSLDRQKTICILNAPGDIRDDQVRKVLRPYGSINRVSIRLDGSSRKATRNVFVEFGEASDAQAAALDRDNSELEGNTIRVRLATDPSWKKIKKEDKLNERALSFDASEAKRVLSALKDEHDWADNATLVAAWLERGQISQRNADIFFQLLQTAAGRIPNLRMRRQERAAKVIEWRKSYQEWEARIQQERIDRQNALKSLEEGQLALGGSEEQEIRLVVRILAAAQKRLNFFSKNQKKNLKDWQRKADDALKQGADGKFRDGAVDDSAESSDFTDSDDEAAKSKKKPATVSTDFSQALGTTAYDKDVTMEESPPLSPKVSPTPKATMPFSKPSSAETIPVRAVEAASFSNFLAVVGNEDPISGADMAVVFASAAVFLSSKPLFGATIADIQDYVNHVVQSNRATPLNGRVSNVVIERVLKAYPTVFQRTIQLAEGLDGNTDEYVGIWKLLSLA